MDSYSLKQPSFGPIIQYTFNLTLANLDQSRYTRSLMNDCQISAQRGHDKFLIGKKDYKRIFEESVSHNTMKLFTFILLLQQSECFSLDGRTSSLGL